jgi:uncharacterized protein
MDNTSGELLYSATDLVAFTGCRVRSAFDMAVATKRQEDVCKRFGIGALKRGKDDPMAEIMQHHGDKHEKAHLDYLISKNLSVVDIPKSGSSAERIEATKKALTKGPEVIFQAALRRDNFVGYADFLIRSNNPQGHRQVTYDIADTKLARSNRAKFMLQLGLYADMLEPMQGSLPQKLIVVLGGSDAADSGSATSAGREFPTLDYVHYTRAVKAKFLEFVKDPVKAIQSVDPIPVAACALCPWQNTCESIWVGRDDLSLIANIRRSQILALGKVGIKTRKELTKQTGDVDGIGTPVLNKIRQQAALQLKAESAPQALPAPVLLPVGPKPTGFALLPPPDPGDLYFDMEGYPYEPGGLEYLFGLGWREGVTDNVGKLTAKTLKQQFVFKAFWAHNRAEEKLAFEQFMDFVTEHLKKHPKAHIYHYAPYEDTAIKRLAGAHDTRLEQRDELLRQGKLVDLYRVVAGGLLLGLPGYSIKKVEAYYRTSARETTVTNGGQSIVQYERYRLLEDNQERSQIIQELHDYNKDDVLSTLELHNWLQGLRPSDSPSLVPGNIDDEADNRTDRQNTADDKRRANAAERAAALAAKKERARGALTAWRSGGNDQVERIAELLGHLIDFYWRCKLPALWRQFQRATRPEIELIDDLECLALLEKSAAPSKEAKSYRYAYRVPPQETKLATKDAVACLTDGGTASNFIYDENGGIASFTRSTGATPPPDVLTLCATKDVSTDTKLEAICDFIIDIAAGMDTALGRLLQRAKPRLKGRASGATIVAAPETGPVIEAVRAMDRSHLVIQGPPGTGKTTTAAAVIAALLDGGCRVAITSNSHAAIDNLLTRAVEQGKSQPGRIKAAKVQSEEIAEGDLARFDGITRIQSNQSSDGYNLLGGTSWAFSRQEHRGPWDYLFVDEASQVSLADIVAIAPSARNIVLLGDQMQLSQPIEGTHPGESGLSVLEYLMQNHLTVPEDEGIFLGVTHRMHPELCLPISVGVYEGRLKASPDCARQKLLLSPGHDPALRATGLVYLPVPHDGCSQSSEAECERIKTLYNNLLRQEWQDKRGPKHRITVEDILVVAPYNAQVRRLREALGSGARVGTVDKFQGQEAAVCIVSQASSNAEEMPRGIDFLFSRNRLNVAVSRAKCLSVIVASPGLEAMTCEAVEDMARLNFYESLLVNQTTQ